jgi:hypothetical protein
MEWLIEGVKANPIQFLSMLISAVALGVAASSLLTSRQSMKTAKQALGATHLPNMGLDLRFEPHEGRDQNEKHLQVFLRNRGAVPAIDLDCAVTISREGREEFFWKKKPRAEPNESWSWCLQSGLVAACLKLAPEVFEASQREEDIKLRIAVRAPQIGIGIKLNWNSPAYGIEPVELHQYWELEPTSFSEDRHCRGWSLVASRPHRPS